MSTQGTTLSNPLPANGPVKKLNSDAAVNGLLDQFEDLKVATREIDEFFVWPEESRPDISHDEFDFDLPVIDLWPVFRLEKLREELAKCEGDSSLKKTIQEDIDSCESAKGEVGRQIREASEEYGFFQIVNHGFPMVTVQNLTDVMLQIFDFPLETKMKVSQQKSVGVTGYGSMKRNTPFSKTANSHIWNEGFDILQPGRSSPVTLQDVAEILWPEPENEGKRRLLLNTADEYGKQASRLILLLLDLMASSLGLPKGCLEDLLGYSLDGGEIEASLRINHYPVCARPELTWGIRNHTDPSVITLLHQDSVGGLQICFKDGTWHGVRPLQGSLVVNVADFLQVWTNGRFLSAEHRVVANEKSRRLSIAYFVLNNPDAHLAPRPELVDAEHPLKYRPFTRKEYFQTLVAHGLSKDRKHLLDKVCGVQSGT